MLRRIGIMQGRIIPENISKLQIFPISNWEEEILKTKDIGFNSVELLLDKDLYLKSIISKPNERRSLGISQKSSTKTFLARSINLDALSYINIIKNEKIFLNILEGFLSVSGDSSIEILVIPFCNTNTIYSLKDLIEILEFFDKNDLDIKAKGKKVILSLEISNIGAQIIQKAFSSFQFSNISICLDLGNSIEEGFKPKDEINRLGSLISHIHIKDKTPEGRNVMLGRGGVNFQNSMKELKEIGYEGQLILETPYKKNPMLEAKTNREYLVSILRNL